MSDFKDGQRQLELMLGSMDKWENKSQNILTKIFRRCMVISNVDVAKWNNKMLKFLNNPRNRVPKDPRTRSSVRGNLSKAILKNKMTWMSLEKGIRLLDPHKAFVTLYYEQSPGLVYKINICLLTGAEVDDLGNPIVEPTN